MYLLLLNDGFLNVFVSRWCTETLNPVIFYILMIQTMLIPSGFVILDLQNNFEEKMDYF